MREIHGIPYDECIGADADARDMAARTTSRRSLSARRPSGCRWSRFTAIPAAMPPSPKPTTKAMRAFCPMIRGWVEADIPHGSAVMLPDGQMFGRVMLRRQSFEPIDCISVAGDDLHFWYADAGSVAVAEFRRLACAGLRRGHDRAPAAAVLRRDRRVRHRQSRSIEQLMRLGVGEIVIVDDDQMEERNVNRILNSTMEDAAAEAAQGRRARRCRRAHGARNEGHPAHRRTCGTRSRSAQSRSAISSSAAWTRSTAAIC